MLGSLCASPRLRGARNIRRKNTKKVLPPLPPKTPESRRKEKKKETSMYTFWMDVAVLPSSFQCTMHFGSGRRRLESLLNIERRVLTATPLSNSAAVFLARKRVRKVVKIVQLRYLYTSVMASGLCARDSKKKGRTEEGFQDSSVQSCPRKSNPMLNKRCVDCELIQMWWCECVCLS
jgi:hypothetical protein